MVGAGVDPAAGRSSPILMHVPKLRELHNGNILSPLTVSEGPVKHFGAAQCRDL